MIKIIASEQTFSLRRSVLRKNMPQESHEFLGDNDDDTFHLGYFSGSEILGVLTLMKSEENSYQLRGMAIAENHQGKNLGKELVIHAEQILRKKGISYIWMNARETAIPFYKKLGYVELGDYFEIKPIGKHIKMEKMLDL